MSPYFVPLYFLGCRGYQRVISGVLAPVEVSVEVPRLVPVEVLKALLRAPRGLWRAATSIIVPAAARRHHPGALHIARNRLPSKATPTPRPILVTCATATITPTPWSKRLY